MSADEATPVALRDASTVMLLRDTDAGIEVFLQRRVKGMAFSAGATVFPGGGVDPQDVAAAPNPGKRYLYTAARETFEECGVLLAGTADSVVTDTSGFRADRERLEKHELGFGDFLDRNGLAVREDLLRPWSNWITPIRETRRYDTRFFVAALPDGQVADGATSESEHSYWRSPAAAIADWVAGDGVLMPPTWSQLTSLLPFSTVAEVFAATPDLEPILPVVVDVDGHPRVQFSHTAEYYEAGGRRPTLS